MDRRGPPDEAACGGQGGGAFALPERTGMAELFLSFLEAVCGFSASELEVCAGT
jgi:hypothetical protein